MSANPYRGEVEFDLCGRTHKLVVNTGVLAEIESTTGVSFFDDAITQKCRSISFITSACAIAMSQRCPDPGVLPKDVAAMIDAEGLPAVGILANALMSAFTAWGAGPAKTQTEVPPSDPTEALPPSA